MKEKTDLCEPGTVQIEVEGLGTFSLQKGESVLSVLRKNDLVTFSNCGGRGTCGKCVVCFLSGAPLPLPADRRRFSPGQLRQGYRLACLAKPQTDCRIRCLFAGEEMKILTEGAFSEADSFREQEGLTEGDALREHEGLMEGNTLREHDGLTEGDAFREQEGLTEGDVFRTCERAAKSAQSREEDAGGAYYVAVDIGTTTIVMQLVQASSGAREGTCAYMNPQRRFGTDVISRLQASIEGESGTLKQLVRREIEQGIREFLAQGYPIQLIVVAANTAMVHLFMGWDVKTLAAAPFTPAHTGEFRTEILGITTVIIPSVSAYVGGDITAGILVCGEDMKKKGYEAALLVDLGTNGEMALLWKDRVYATATAAGPAFEGSLDAGVYGADLIRITAGLLEEGILDRTGLMCEPYFDTGVERDRVWIRQKNVRDLQMAKAAVYAGTQILLKKAGLKGQEIEHVYLAGGFGYYLDVSSACRIGVLPRAWEAKTEAVGNTALTGAVLYGKGYLAGPQDEDSRSPGRRAEEICAKAAAVNLAQEPQFEAFYLSSMELEEKTEEG